MIKNLDNLTFWFDVKLCRGFDVKLCRVFENNTKIFLFTIELTLSHLRVNLH